MLEATNVRKEFGAVVAVADVSLSLPPAAFVAIVGKSGSGKSTLMALLGALDRPTAGSIVVEGHDIAQLSDRDLTSYRANHVGFVFQAYNLIPNLTALQNVMLPLEFRGAKRAFRRQQAELLLGMVGLDAGKHHKRPATLSGGEQQRVAIARALANKPRIVLADEPTGNLDSETGALIIDLLRRLSRSERMTVVAVTHDAAIKERCDQWFELRDGRIVGQGRNAPKPAAPAAAVPRKAT
ncbi:MAG TPA: ABC transporter ATP-binding protein [Candidatus Thermoplasmatota archaeon]|nr:ABC transporter ATP-binding protein [Candidatus Thermoplasmatota archaeon]